MRTQLEHTARRGFGYENGDAFRWGDGVSNTPRDSVRYAPSGRVGYKFADLDTNRSYVIRPTIKGTSGHYQQLQFNGLPAGQAVPVPPVPATFSLAVGKHHFANTNRSFVFTLANTDATGHEVPGDSAVVALELNEFTGAGFINSDTDHDGMPDWWELKFRRTRFSLDPSQNDAALDLDGDGFPNLAEYLAGTDPTDPTSRLGPKALPSRTVGAELLVQWSSRPGRVYTLEWSPDLRVPFTPLQAGILADVSGTNTFVWNTVTRPAGFLRVRVGLLTAF